MVKNNTKKKTKAAVEKTSVNSVSKESNVENEVFVEKDNKFSTIIFIFLFIFGLFLYNYYNAPINNVKINDSLTNFDMSNNVLTYGEILNVFNNQSINKSDKDLIFSSDKVIKLSSKKEFRDFLRLKALTLNSDEGSNFDGLMREKGMVVATADTSFSEEGRSSNSNVDNVDVESLDSKAEDFSKTNVQEENVDEPDIVKNDGEYIYTLSGNKIVITKAFPVSDLSVLTKIEYNKSARIEDFFIKGNNLVVFSRDYKKEVGVGSDFYPITKSSIMTAIKIYDISNRETPKLKTEYLVKGHYYSARLIDNYVYFISKSNFYYFGRDFDVPVIYRDGVKLPMPEIYYFNPGDSNSFDFFTIGSFNLNDLNEELKAKTIFGENIENLYVSKNNIYLAYKKYERFDRVKLFREVILPKLPNEIADSLKDEKDLDVISSKLEEYYNQIGFEKAEKLFDGLKEDVEKYVFKVKSESQKTIISKFAIKNGTIEFVNKGLVNGYLLNQFSLSEGETGDLRVATTVSFWTREGSKSFNNVYILDSDLKLKGKLEDLANGEKIYSTRFMGDKLFMVTYKRIDPLFVIDLSGNEPKVLGKLKIPGYSTYLHPYDENLLIGLGYETKEIRPNSFVNDGVKLTLFDISDFNNPKEVDTYVVDGKFSSSLALYDHHAFLFSKSKHLLVIPIRKYVKTGDENDYNNYFFERDAYVFNVTSEGFNLRGIVKHSDNEKEDYYWWNSPNSIERSVYMDNVLYTISQKKILANDLDDNLKKLGELDLGYSEKNDDDVIIYN